MCSFQTTWFSWHIACEFFPKPLAFNHVGYLKTVLLLLLNDLKTSTSTLPAGMTIPAEIEKKKNSEIAIHSSWNYNSIHFTISNVNNFISSVKPDGKITAKVMTGWAMLLVEVGPV